MGVHPGYGEPDVLVSGQIPPQGGEAPEQGRTPRVSGVVGGKERKAVYNVRKLNGDLLGYGAAHRVPHDVGPGYAKLCQDSNGVLRHIPDGVRRLRPLAQAAVPVIDDNYSERVLQELGQWFPAAVVAAKAGDEQHGRTAGLSEGLVVEAEAVGIYVWHCEISRITAATRVRPWRGGTRREAQRRRL